MGAVSAGKGGRWRGMRVPGTTEDRRHGDGGWGGMGSVTCLAGRGYAAAGWEGFGSGLLFLHYACLGMAGCRWRS